MLTQLDVYKAIVDFVEHAQADLLSSVFKTCPLQVFEHGLVESVGVLMTE